MQVLSLVYYEVVRTSHAISGCIAIRLSPGANPHALCDVVCVHVAVLKKNIYICLFLHICSGQELCVPQHHSVAMLPCQGVDTYDIGHNNSSIITIAVTQCWTPVRI